MKINGATDMNRKATVLSAYEIYAEEKFELNSHLYFLLFLWQIEENSEENVTWVFSRKLFSNEW